MKEYQSGSIRNVGLFGHGGEGKTTLAEAMLFQAGIIDRMGKVTDGNTVTDYDLEENKRGISISLSLAPIEWRNAKINVLDVPGYFDMVGEVSSALCVADVGIILCNAVSGISVGAEKAWTACEKKGVARAIVVNQMDRENANFQKVLDAAKEKFGATVVAMQMPIMDGGFKGFVDLLRQKAYLFDGKKLKDTDIPASVADEMGAMREAIMEAAAGADDALMEKFFAEGELSDEEIMDGLKAGLKEGMVCPVYCASAFENKNASALLDAIVDYFPAPSDKAAAKGKNASDGDETRKADDAEPFSAFVFKTISDNFVGKQSFFKIMSGKIGGEIIATNMTASKQEKLHHVSTMMGKKLMEVPVMHAGDIGVFAKLTVTLTGDTLCDPAKPIQYPPVQFPEPSIGFAVTAEKQGEEDKVFGGLNRLHEEDPSFRVGKDPETGETLLRGQGEMHLDVVINKLKNKFNASAALNDPRIPYRETIRKKARVQGRHKKQSGGHGQFGDIWVEFEPIMGEAAEFEFVDKVVGGVVPKQFIPAVEKGLRECIVKGPLAGCKVVNLRCTLVDGSFHAVDSSEMAFKTAAHVAFKKGILEASPVLLEPICRVQVNIPDEYMGDIIGDMNRRRGRIMGMNPQEYGQEVVAEVPLSEMFKYATDLRSMTQARGSFTMAVERYDDVPQNIAAKIIEAAKASMEEDEE